MDINEEDSRFDAGNDGYYAIMCFNKNKLPTSKIKDDYSKFGEVVNIKQLESGCVFIRYKERSELISCFKEMSVNPKYNAKLPYGNQNKPGRNDKQKEHRTKGDEQSYEGTSVNSKNNSYSHPASDNLKKKGSNQKPDHPPVGPRVSTSSFDEPPSLLVDISEGAFRCDRTAHNSHNLSSPPPLKLHCNVAWEKELKKIHDVPAVEVVVANLPPGMYQRELYIMFDRCSPEIEPVHIEMNFTPPPYELYYATVFVKTLRHAQKLISSVDGRILEGNYLVAELADKILEKVYNKQNKKHLKYFDNV